MLKTNCNECDVWFQSEIVDGDLLYVCNLCEKEFSETDNLKEHQMKTHEVEIGTYAAGADESVTFMKETKCEYKI